MTAPALPATTAQIDEALRTIRPAGPNTSGDVLRRTLAGVAGIAAMVGQAGAPAIEAIRAVLAALGR